MKKLISLVAFLCLILSSYGQKVKGLTVGDTVPDIPLNNILHYKTTSARLSDYKDKLVIFDFYATWCGGCIGAIPHIKELEKQFGDSLRTFLVNTTKTGDTRAKIEGLFEKQPLITMPTIVEDSLIDNLFPHHSLPHYVWVYNGVVRAITDPKLLTPENIRLAMSNKKMTLPVKFDFPNVNLKRSMFTDTFVLDEVIEHSILTRAISGVPGGSGWERDSSGKATRIYAQNQNLFQLYQHAYPVLFKYNKNRMISETPLVEQESEQRYCYDLKLPPAPIEMFEKRMRADLFKAFHLRVYETTRSLECLIITKTKHSAKLFDTAGKKSSTLIGFYMKRGFHNCPLSGMVRTLRRHTSLPILDETGITSPVSIDGLPQNLSDIDGVKKALDRYGLTIISETRKIKVCIIAEQEIAEPLTNTSQ